MKHYPCSATYLPKHSRLAYPVRVLQERTVYGRQEFLIQSAACKDGDTAWVTAGKDGTQLTFINQEEG